MVQTMKCSQKSTFISGSASNLVISIIYNISTSYFEHIVNLANVGMMGYITKIAIVENATAIWKYNPDLYDNCVLGGLLNMIDAICTMTIKVWFLFLRSLLVVACATCR